VRARRAPVPGILQAGDHPISGLAGVPFHQLAQIQERLRPLEHSERLDWLRLRRHLERQRMEVAAECAAKLREVIELAVELELGRAAGPSQIRRLEVTTAGFDRVVGEAGEIVEGRDQVSQLVLSRAAWHGLDISDFGTDFGS
jgi:hypothetical protein